MAAKPWVKSLQKSPFKELQEMAPELETIIDAADKALAMRSAVQAEIFHFRTVGARFQLFGKVNGARKTADGDLTKIAIDTPGLPSDFSSKFFRTASAETDQSNPTIASVTEHIGDLEAELVTEKALLDQLQKEANAAKDAEDEKAADEATLAAIQKEEEVLKKKAEELKKKLGLK